jgi:LPXTG-motif cell wall-anchored protein
VTSAPAIVGVRPWFTWPLLPDAEAGAPYSVALPLATNDTATFMLTDGELPPGIDLDSDGTVAGTTTEAGEFTFEVVATTIYGTAETEFTLVVTPGATAALEVSVSATQVPQGGSLTFQVQGIDDFDNSTGDLTDDAVVTSDVLTDTVVGNTVTFPHASPHTLTVSYGQLSAHVVIEVVPQAVGGGADLAATGVDEGVALGGALGAGALAIGIASVLYRRTRRTA